jgi:rhodanese-related sulfurtransferase
LAQRGRAANAVKAAIQLGYTKICCYAEGMAEWKEKGLPVSGG